MASPPPDLASSDRILTDLAFEIQCHHRCYLRSFQIEKVPGGVILRGSAVSYYGKQLAFHEVTRKCNCRVVANAIEVEGAIE